MGYRCKKTPSKRRADELLFNKAMASQSNLTLLVSNVLLHEPHKNSVGVYSKK